MKALAAILMIAVTLPIWLYLLYQILLRVEASELMWFLFWVYVPLNLFVGVLGKFMEREK